MIHRIRNHLRYNFAPLPIIFIITIEGMSTLKEHLSALKRSIKGNQLQVDFGLEDIPPTQSTTSTIFRADALIDEAPTKKIHLDEELEELFDEIDSITSGKPHKAARVEESPSEINVPQILDVRNEYGDPDLEALFVPDDVVLASSEKENTRNQKEAEKTLFTQIEKRHKRMKRLE